MPDYAVSTAFTAKDQGIIDAYERMGRAADTYGDRASRAFDRVGGAADHASTSLRNATKHGYSFGAILKGIVAANLIHGAVGAVGGAIKDTTKEYLHFDDEISQAVAKFSDLGPHVKGFEGHVSSLGKAVRKVGVESKFPLEQLASGINQIARSKIFPSTQAIEALIPLMRLNIDAQEDFGESTRNIMGMMGAWALKTDNAAETMANYKEMVNLVSFANNSALVSVTDLAETMKTVGPAARSMGYGIRDVTAMTTFLARAGIKGTEASTALRNIFMHLARPDFVQDLANLKIPIVENGKFRPLRDFFLDLEKFIGKLEPAKAKAFLDILFGMRGSAGGNDILRQIKEYGHLEDQMAHVKNEMDDMANRLNDTKLNRIERFRNKLTDKTWQIFDKYADNFAAGVNKMMVAVDRFNMTPLIQGLTATGMLLKGAYTLTGPLIATIPQMTAAYIAWGLAAKTCGAQLALVDLYMRQPNFIVTGSGVITAVSNIERVGAALLTWVNPLYILLASVGAISAIQNAQKDSGNAAASRTVAHEDREYEVMGIGARKQVKETEHHVYFHSEDGRVTMKSSHERAGVSFHTTIPKSSLGVN